MTKVNCVLFDLGGVILNWDNSWLVDEISQRFNLSKTKFESEFEKNLGILSSGKMTEKVFWKIIGSSLNSSELEEQDSLLESVFRRFVSINHYVLNLSTELKDRGVSVGILSNTEPVTYSVIEEMTSFDHFDFKFLSYEIGHVKPDYQIYQHVVQKLPFKKEELFFIDDNPINVKSANDFGLKTIQFSNYDKLLNDLQTMKIL